MAAAFAIAALVPFTVVSAAFAQSAAPVLWLGGLTRLTEANFLEKGIGGRAYHLDAMTAQRQGGHALPLADYSEEVMRQFVLDQEAMAAKVGVTRNAVDAAVADAFFAWTRTLAPTDGTSE